MNSQAKSVPLPGAQCRNHATRLIGPANYPLAYFNNPKAACSTVKNLLYRIQHGVWLDDPLEIHRRIRHQGVLLSKEGFASHRQTARFDRPYTTFTFVREPGRRIYSSFIEKIWATGKYAIPGARNFLVAKMAYTLPPLEAGKPSLDELRRGFKQFLTFVRLGVGPHASDPHWACQYRRLREIEPADHVSFVGRVETFARDMAMILDRAGWPDPSIADCRFNEGPKAPYGFEEVIDDEIATLLVELYGDDYSAFGYRLPTNVQPLQIARSAESPFRGQMLVCRRDRLGMRLAMIVQTWRFAREIGYQTVALWPSGEINREKDQTRAADSYPIEDFFDVPATLKAIGDDSLVFRDDCFRGKETFVDRDLVLVGQFPKRFDRKRSGELPKCMNVDKLAMGLQFTDEKPAVVKRACGELFRKLVPAAAVTRALAVLTEAVGQEPFLAIHVRRGDILRTLRGHIMAAPADPVGELPPELARYARMLNTKVAPLACYRELLAKHQSGVKRIVLFTDSPELANAIQTEFAPSVPLIAVHEVATPDANANQRSLAELLLLTRSNMLIGTQSAFSRVAHMIGLMPFHDAGAVWDSQTKAVATLEEFAADLLDGRPMLRALLHQLLRS